MAARVSATRLVGRAQPLAELEASRQDAATGRARLVFLAGESGVGKSRLLSAFARAARADGALVLSGDCVDLGEGELPYAPLVAALRPLVREEHPALAALPADLARELALFLPGLPGDGASSQARLFEALLALVVALAAAQPVVLIVEDLHWADRDTRAFLAFLGRSVCAERFLLVGSYRPDELHRRHPLRPLLAALEREPIARRIALDPLTEEELAEQLEDILGAPPAPDLVTRLWQRSEGNPLHTEELLAAGLDGRGALPPTLRDALMLRIERLSPAAQETVRVLAAGGRLDHPLLLAAGELDAATLREALREAVAAHLLAAAPDGTYAFRHALLREVVADDLLPGERAELHLALAGALEERAAGGEDGAFLAAAIAHHYLSAGDQPRALRATVRAADAAWNVHAHGAAAELMDRALELWPRVPNAAEEAGEDEATLLLWAADARLMMGERERQDALLRRALTRVDAAAEPERVAVLLDRLSRAEWAQGRHDEALATQARALSLMPAGGPPAAARARVVAGAAKLNMLRARYRDAITQGREALAEARAVDDDVAESIALNALGVSLMWSEDAVEGERLLREAMRIACEADRPDELCSSYLNLADALHARGRSEAAIALTREGLETIGGLGRHQRRWMSMNVVEFLLDLGRPDEARAAFPAIARNERIGSLELFTGVAAAGIALRHGDLDAARAELLPLEGTVASYLEPQFTAPYARRVAELERREGHLEAARAAVAAGLDRIVTCTDDASRVAHVAAAGMTVEADIAQRARDRGDAAAAADALARAELHLGYVEAAAPGRPVETALLVSARAELTRARGVSDPAAWLAARAAWEELDWRSHAARAGLEAAEASLEAHDRDGAARLLADVVRVTVPVGLRQLTEDARGLAARARLPLAPDPAGPRAPAAPVGEAVVVAAAAPAEVAGDPFGLTPRERQVLTLLAEGATNRAIGERLFMAEKTASVHVSRILAKLDVPNRTQAAAVAHRLGLDATPAPPAPA